MRTLAEIQQALGEAKSQSEMSEGSGDRNEGYDFGYYQALAWVVGEDA